ncbi:ATPase, T2SS/T4P/T4SS family [Rubinisphaera margarita]|uniref:ATPase, T2SS/T4P/T4SS family n=1 Tax=Rubinisphaera margarita TaxID=2909586 RepID=UPI001EE90E1E|nr:ATPase, T2SS/T4P/T4SS family [Rubinisphaera margarita]MCG6155672.1 Flp pilus assembly complex ATPase component TadA [Rubinisphaera margarita]
MIFGFGKKSQDDDLEDEVELVLFQGTISGVEVDIAAHARLAEVGLLRAKELVTDALERRAEMLRIEPKGEKGAMVQLYVDGIGYSGGRLIGKEAIAVTQVLKLVGGMDPKDRTKPQTGGIRAEFDDRKYLLVIETRPGKEGERLNLHLVDVKNAKYSPSELGFSEESIAKIREMTGKKGIVLAAGPPGSGVTSLAFAIIRGIDAYVQATFALFDTGHRELGSVSKFERREGEELGTALQRLIRMEGDVAFVEPFDNEKTVREAIEKHEEITMVSEMKARDAASAIENLGKILKDPKSVAEAVNGVFGQKLIRRLCEKCKQPYRPNPKLIQKVGLPEDVQTLYRPPQPEPGEDLRPCRRCGGSGYLGRAAMIELIEMTDDMKKVVAAGGDAAAIKAQARKEKMLTFKEEGLKYVAEGETSLEELQRVFRAQ